MNSKNWEPLKNCSTVWNNDTCVVVGNGPSLDDVPAELFEKYPTFGANMVWKRFHPDVYFISGADQLAGVWGRQKTKAALEAARYGFLNIYAGNISTFWKPVQELDHVYPISSMDYEGNEPVERQVRLKWSYDISERFGIANTVLYIALQAALYMGFKRALMVGIDHDYTTGKGKHFFTGRGLTPDEDTPKGGQFEWGSMANIAFKIAARVFTGMGGEVLNLTPNSKATGLKRGKLDDWL